MRVSSFTLANVNWRWLASHGRDSRGDVGQQAHAKVVAVTTYTSFTPPPELLNGMLD
ncbi:hypothetical protein MYA_3384 [Burkholderia sp. KJ006]|uniref:hypothetical protein n=1 Tax=Burkholderia sp. KJ006 TaxID=416344 RepID=UPI00025F0C1D|nr:hypothetical protein [Burkholderia sp. KJ006]AFJ87743.1 hypothetical protein MYA_3384 [Burkholderia sp. KJ006]